MATVWAQCGGEEKAQEMLKQAGFTVIDLHRSRMIFRTATTS
ncbi:MAG: hypothetical protein ACR2M8_00865 [Pyrinomonadaceae bacterium]